MEESREEAGIFQKVILFSRQVNHRRQHEKRTVRTSKHTWEDKNQNSRSKTVCCSPVLGAGQAADAVQLLLFVVSVLK